MRLSAFCAAVLSLMCSVSAQAADPVAGDYPFQPVPFSRVKVEGGFWGPRFETNRRVAVWSDFRKCEETGRISNFARAGGLEAGGFQGIPFDDSDVVKVVEGAAYLLAQQPDPRLDEYLDALIVKIAAAQEDDGYLYTARTLGFTNDMTGPARWSNLGASHELYNVGHLYEAAVAHYQATGKRTLLEVALRNADFLCRMFGPAEGQRVDVPGHEEIEIGLVKLYRATGERKYLDLARFFIDMRGRKDKRPRLYGEYAQDHQPLVEQDEAVGHAVRGGYLYAGAADVAALTGDREYIAALDRIWQDVVGRKLYLTGNVGQFDHGEGYEGAYQLPNLKAYNETCAAIALALWNHRMFLLHGDAKYIDVLERTLYNGFLAGVSLSGDRFFYPNPLACDARFPFNHGSLERSEWFGVSCCPVNIVRFIPSIAGQVYARREDSIYVNLFVAGQGDVELGTGTVRLSQQTDYPWSGTVRITVRPDEPREFALHVRVPGWAQGRPLPGDLYQHVDTVEGSSESGRNGSPSYSFRINGDPVAATALERGYAVLRRTWQPGDVVDLDLALPVRRVLGHEQVAADRGRVAVERGPVVYCVEGADHDGKALNLVLRDDAELTPEHRPDLLGGVTVLRGRGLAASRAHDNSIETTPAALTLIPYYAWCHRGPNEMQVWLPRTADLADVGPPRTLATTSRASASHCWQNETVAALNDARLPQNSGDHGLPRFTWWDHRGGGEWVQYDFPQPAHVSQVGVYWFDDTGRGQCRVPASWRVLFRAGDEWKPVSNPGDYGVERDRFNDVRFDAVTTDGLRIEAQLRAGFSGGILEWTAE